jgi:type III restriction enzyme
VEKIRKASHTRRLMKLSRLLTAMHNIDPDALDDSKKLVLDVLKSEMARLCAEDPDFDKKVSSYSEITVRAVTVEQGIWKELPSEPVQVARSDTDVDDLFHRVGQRLGEGLHQDYWQANYDGDNPNRPKLELFLTLQDQKAWETLEKACAERINALFETHKNAIKKLKSSEREQYNKVREIAKDSEAFEFVPPNEVIVTIDKSEARAYSEYHKHLYVREDGKYLAKLNSWEKAVIEEEIARDEVVGWLRNYERKSWALSLPYEYAGKRLPMFPDFFIIRKNDSAYNVDILEPHAATLADSWAKAKGLAEFATKHGDHFGRIELIRMVGNSLKRLDLNDDKNRKKVLAVSNNQHLDQIFDGL